MKLIEKQMEGLTLPQEILDHISFLLNNDGGIKQVDADLLKLMLNHSSNLISKCTYCNILKATNSEKLEEFLTIGGWNLIYIWIKAARDDGSSLFLTELLDLLNIMPMSMSRLRENECPKIVKKLCKHDNEEVAKRANQIIKKWTKIIQSVTEKGNSGSSVDVKEKKRKTVNSSDSNVKKLKTKSNNKSEPSSTPTATPALGPTAAAVKHPIGSSFDSGDSNTSASNDISANNVAESDSIELSLDTTKSSETKEVQKEPLKIRPVTVKVKQGKFRLNLVETTPSVKSVSSLKKKEGIVKEVKSDDIKKIMSRSTVSTTLKTAIGNNSMSSKAAVAAASAVSTPNHILKDSLSFMEAIAAMPIITKKRKVKPKEAEIVSSSTTKISTLDNDTKKDSIEGVLPFNSNSNEIKTNDVISNDKSLKMIEQTVSKIEESKSDKINEQLNLDFQRQCSPPRFSFYKDILEDKIEEESISKVKLENKKDNTDSTIISSSDNKDINRVDNVANKLDNIETIESSNNDNNSLPLDTNTNAPRSILNYLKKGVKKNVRWAEDSKLESVRYFELDETERINVTRPTADMKRFDMKHEAQLMMEAKKGICYSYFPWKLIPLDLNSHDILVEKGCNSKEKEIQAELQKTTLECFYIQNMIPDSAKEPDSSFYLDSLRHDPVIIPLEDENSFEKSNQDYNAFLLNSDQPINNFEYPAYSGDNSQQQGYIPSNDANTLPPSYSPNTTNIIPSSSTGAMSNFGSSNSNYQSMPNPSNYLPPVNMYDQPNNGPLPYNQTSNQYSNNVQGTAMPPPNSLPPPFANSNNTNSNNSNNNNNNQMYSDYGHNTNYPPPSDQLDVPMGNQDLPPPPSQQQSQPQPPPPFVSNNPLPPPFFNQGPSQNESLNYNNPNNNNYWNDTPNFPPMRGGWPGGAPGPRPNRMRGMGAGRGGRGFMPRGPNSNNICRFFLKFGKCKFEQRCNFSHNVDNKPNRF